jgi:hypothetical protein
LARHPGRNDVRKLDAIIVPTARPAWYLEHATALAHELGTSLLVISGEMQPPRLGQADVARKRNDGLETARNCGWRYVMFLDDDIRVTASQVRDALAQLAHLPAVAFRATMFPDHSVVYHGDVATGGKHDVRPGAGALLLDVGYPHPDFLPVYNQDWLFLHDLTRLHAVADAGEVQQLMYDPFDPERARAEEFGDVLAEGLYRLIDEDRPVEDALGEEFWAGEITRRSALIEDVLTRPDRAVQRALTASAEELSRVTPAALVRFVCDWRKLP